MDCDAGGGTQDPGTDSVPGATGKRTQRAQSSQSSQRRAKKCKSVRVYEFKSVTIDGGAGQS